MHCSHFKGNINTKEYYDLYRCILFFIEYYDIYAWILSPIEYYDLYALTVGGRFALVIFKTLLDINFLYAKDIQVSMLYNFLTVIYV